MLRSLVLPCRSRAGRARGWPTSRSTRARPPPTATSRRSCASVTAARARPPFVCGCACPRAPVGQAATQAGLAGRGDAREARAAARRRPRRQDHRDGRRGRLVGRAPARRALRRVRRDDAAAGPAGRDALLPGGAGVRAGRASVDRDSRSPASPRATIANRRRRCGSRPSSDPVRRARRSRSPRARRSRTLRSSRPSRPTARCSSRRRRRSCCGSASR